MKMEPKKSRFYRLQALLTFFFVHFCVTLASSSKIQKFRDIIRNSSYNYIGINYGRLGHHLPQPEEVLELVKYSLSIKHVKTFDMNPSVTRAFANTGITLSLCIPDEKIPLLASNYSRAESLIETFILPFYNDTRISIISVGNEVSNDPAYSHILVPAMLNIHRALKKYLLYGKISVSTTHSVAILAAQFPPAAATFNDSIAESVLRPMLTFLYDTRSPFMVNLYPYLTYKESLSIPLEFALFPDSSEAHKYTDPNTRLTYTNLFDILVDAFISASSSLGFPDLPLVVSETGWPSQGTPDDSAASVSNAAIYNQRLIKHVTAKPMKGTPLRPGMPIPTYIFSLFDEDQKPGPAVENHWGVLYANGTRKYGLNIKRRSST